MKDPLFASNPMVTGKPGVRFYAGIPLKDFAGFNIGTLCIIDTVPRKLNDFQKKFLHTLAQSAIDYIVLKKSRKTLKEISNEFKNYFNLIPDLLCIASPEGFFKEVNTAFVKELGYSEKELLKQPFLDFVHPEDKEKTIQVWKAPMKRKRFETGIYAGHLLLSCYTNRDKMIFATARNVTERKRKRSSKRKISKRFSMQNVLNSCSDSRLS
ncbi:MAG: PAS domain S-box protein [Bacteroidetes bacterium]|nr:PAS domain S-box protein [Bacteroidota bacterium]